MTVTLPLLLCRINFPRSRRDPKDKRTHKTSPHPSPLSPGRGEPTVPTTDHQLTDGSSLEIVP